ncbi:hypothetical protein DYI25_11405 [Mesobacillus boroniphilus]|uniref:Uncharacterized protein n=1 Tax=Mesobacillus boroniphilus TaxID=308892 RepID=A0A944CL08_9BACI|nr:hypothetical protein [Mesobacillus boroniphilus]
MTSAFYFHALFYAHFSNFVVIDYKIGVNELFFFPKYPLVMRKEHANLIPNYRMAFYYVKIGFRILTTIFTKKQPSFKKDK